ncbi:hypothetical protein CspeluHIS016_0802730 [Cutaneotrichosporon spelunceum]|uniref:Uncharacterized protein n=1 Tax=Cutaneotrichosporon spelunceum TaxID=1672016 RepID=A0AAD3U0A4_9TREE|nr:hypothetical protein CspeluHIS016_0802730 [Cutaneotrichosporon spelunceum]
MSHFCNNTSIHTPYASGYDTIEESWAPLVPGIFDLDLDLDPCADSPVKMSFDFEPLHYEVKIGPSHSAGTGRPPKWTLPKSDVGINMSGETRSETQRVVNIEQASAPPSAGPCQHISTPSLLRAPHLPTLPLTPSPHSPLIPAADQCVIPICPIEGTRAQAAPHFSALGLDFTATAEFSYPSPTTSPTAGRGRRRARASTAERSQDAERGRTRERRRRTEDDEVPDLSYSHDERSLRDRVADWSSAVYAATSSPSTPPESTPIALALYDQAELTTALSRLNAEAVGPIRIPSTSIDGVTWPVLRLATSLQHEPAPGAAELAPWALRVGQSRGRLINMPRLRRTATSASTHRV